MYSQTEVTFSTAVRGALQEEMRRDDSVVVLGEDVASAGGVFKVTEGLLQEFGPTRVRDTPISEVAITGMAMGAALNGLRPVLEIMFADFVAVAFDEIINQIAKFRYLTGGQSTLPLVIRAASGAGLGFGAQHSQSPESWLLQMPGLKIAVPSTPADAKGMLKASIRDADPVCFLEHKSLYSTKGPVPLSDDHVVPLGAGCVRRSGNDVTIVAAGLMVSRSQQAAEDLECEGVQAEVIDVRSVSPFDWDLVLSSIEKTGHLVAVEESPGGFGWSAALLARSLESGVLDPMKAKRVTPPWTPIPFSPALEEEWLPGARTIANSARIVMSDDSH